MLESLRLLPKAWYLGNTTVRSPYRIKFALRALNSSGFLIGKGNENETKFAKFLDDSGIVRLQRLDEDPNADVSDMGRKWRSCLVQLGFIYPEEETLSEFNFSFQAFSITKIGKKLIEVQNLSSEQECFLRVLLGQQLPSPVEKFKSNINFNPLRLVLGVIKELELRTEEPKIDKNEMAAIVQTIPSETHIKEAVDAIIRFRHEELNLNGNSRKRFQRDLIDEASQRLESQNSDTLLDYADTNFRYLKLSGLFVSNGQGISISPFKESLVKQILAIPFVYKESRDYLQMFWDGAIIPTDNQAIAIQNIQNLANIISTNFHETVDLPELSGRNIQELNQIKNNLEETILKSRELEYANEQVNQWQEIVEYMLALQNPNRNPKIPSGEAPAYLEWIFWRVFLAIDSLLNKPWEARRFEVDDNFLPRFTAPGGGPDMIFEFENFVIIVEVTLTQSSRQEAVEGEPVRRHVANLVELYPTKSVYCIFIANKVDTNTAETFRIGIWYKENDEPIGLSIVPFTLAQFTTLFRNAYQSNKKIQPSKLEDLILRCKAGNTQPAPSWKKHISQEINRAMISSSDIN
jgi:hypothetical protein